MHLQPLSPSANQSNRYLPNIDQSGQVSNTNYRVIELDVMKTTISLNLCFNTVSVSSVGLLLI